MARAERAVLGALDAEHEHPSRRGHPVRGTVQAQAPTRGDLEAVATQVAGCSQYAVEPPHRAAFAREEVVVASFVAGMEIRASPARASGWKGRERLASLLAAKPLAQAATAVGPPS